MAFNNTKKRPDGSVPTPSVPFQNAAEQSRATGVPIATSVQKFTIAGRELSKRDFEQAKALAGIGSQMVKNPSPAATAASQLLKTPKIQAEQQAAAKEVVNQETQNALLTPDNFNVNTVLTPEQQAQAEQQNPSQEGLTFPLLPASLGIQNLPKTPEVIQHPLLTAGIAGGVVGGAAAIPALGASGGAAAGTGATGAGLVLTQAAGYGAVIFGAQQLLSRLTGISPSSIFSSVTSGRVQDIESDITATRLSVRDVAGTVAQGGDPDTALQILDSYADQQRKYIGALHLAIQRSPKDRLAGKDVQATAIRELNYITLKRAAIQQYKIDHNLGALQSTLGSLDAELPPSS